MQRGLSTNKARLPLLVRALSLLLLGTLCTLFVWSRLRVVLLATLDGHGVSIPADLPRPALAWSMFPPEIRLSNVRLELRSVTVDSAYEGALHVDWVAYRLGPWSRSTARYLKDASNSIVPDERNPPLSRGFASLAWGNVTTVARRPHPQPRLEALGGRIELLTPPLRVGFRRLVAKLLRGRWVGESAEPPPCSMVRLSISKLLISTHTVTSVPIPVSHPTVTDLARRFPSLFNLFARHSQSVDQPDSVLVYPPHLSRFAPSLVFPALYQAISAFRTSSAQQTQEQTAWHYDFPAPMPNATFRVSLARQGIRRTESVAVDFVGPLEHGREPVACRLMQLDVAEMRGRERDGSGGCCAMHLAGLRSHGLGNVTFVGHVPFVSTGSLSNTIEQLLRYGAALLFHPLYLISYALDIQRRIRELRSPDVCSIRSLVDYRVDELVLLDKTGLEDSSSSTVSRVYNQMHGGFLNFFEGALSLVA